MLAGVRKGLVGMKVAVINGPNLNLLGTREPDIYGSITLDQINESLLELAKRYQVDLEFFQSNHEGDLVDAIHRADADADCIILNPAAYTHYGIALRDAVAAVRIPTIEVHLSNIHAREDFRKTSVIAPVAAGQISGFGPASYRVAFYAALELINPGFVQEAKW